MKRFTVMAGFFLGGVLAVQAQTSNQVFVVEVIDQHRNKNYLAMAQADHQKARDDMAIRNRFMSQALDQARSEWKNRKTDGEVEPFPLGVAFPGLVNLIAVCSDKSEADRRIADLIAADKAQKDPEKKTSRDRLLEQIDEQLELLRKSVVPNTRNQNLDKQIRNLEAMRDELVKELSKRKARQAAMDQSLKEAEAAYEAKLNALVTASQTPRK